MRPARIAPGQGIPLLLPTSRGVITADLIITRDQQTDRAIHDHLTTSQAVPTTARAATAVQGAHIVAQVVDRVVHTADLEVAVAQAGQAIQRPAEGHHKDLPAAEVVVAAAVVQEKTNK